MGPKRPSSLCRAKRGLQGMNVIGATEILKTFKPYYSIYSFREGMKAPHVGRFVDKPMRKNPSKDV